jgi:hypothetical protein
MTTSTPSTANMRSAGAADNRLDEKDCRDFGDAIGRRRLPPAIGVCGHDSAQTRA